MEITANIMRSVITRILTIHFPLLTHTQLTYNFCGHLSFHDSLENKETSLAYRILQMSKHSSTVFQNGLLPQPYPQKQPRLSYSLPQLYFPSTITITTNYPDSRSKTGKVTLASIWRCLCSKNLKCSLQTVGNGNM